MSGLVDFLLARIADDESVARGAWPERWEQDGERNAVQTAETGLRGGYEGLHMGVANTAMTVGNYQAEARNAAHIARHDPARVLAECEAKRRIVELHKKWPVLVTRPSEFTPDEVVDRIEDVTYRMVQQMEWMTAERFRETFGDEPPTAPMLAALAAVYADHPDYRQEWKP